MTELCSHNLHIEALSPNVTILGKKVFKGVIEVKLGHKDVALIWVNFYSYNNRKRYQSSFSLCLHVPRERLCDDTRSQLFLYPESHIPFPIPPCRDYFFLRSINQSTCISFKGITLFALTCHFLEYLYHHICSAKC